VPVAKGGISQTSLGQRPKVFNDITRPALKTRLNTSLVKRAFNADF
jgi:hypothetical protein